MFTDETGSVFAFILHFDDSAHTLSKEETTIGSAAANDITIEAN